jgi:nucleoid DNA-binding protein
MNRTDFIDQIAARTQRSRTEVEDVINAALAVIADALANGDKVDLRGFGSFQVSGKNERQGRNPRTGESLTIAAKRVAVFKPSKELAERVNATSGPVDEATEIATAGSASIRLERRWPPVSKSKLDPAKPNDSIMLLRSCMNLSAGNQSTSGEPIAFHVSPKACARVF